MILKAEDLTRIRESILRVLYPLVSVATQVSTITREVRRDGHPAMTDEIIKSQLGVLESTGLAEQVKADGAGGALSPAHRGWKLTGKGTQTAEELVFA
jgi:hypothetical protein